MSMRIMTPALRRQTDARAQRLARFASKAVPDHGINMRNGWPVPSESPAQRITVQLAAAPLVMHRAGIRIKAKFGETWCVKHRFGKRPVVSTRRTFVSQMPLIETIIQVVCRRYNITRNDIMAPHRTKDIVRPRHIAMWLTRQMTAQSLPDIGRRFAGRDHTTIINAVRKFDRLRQDNPAVAAELDELRAQIEVRLPAAFGLE